jgi:hypothetical protein
MTGEAITSATQPADPARYAHSKLVSVHTAYTRSSGHQ